MFITFDTGQKQTNITTCIVNIYAFILGSLIQVEESHKKPILSFAGLGIKPHERKEYVRHCFLFSGLLLIATRSSNGKLHLHKVIKMLSLMHAIASL